MDWKQNKIIFNYVINQNYIIKKDIDTTNILFIKWNQFEMKCKYFLAFSVDDKNNIIWSCDNPYIDQKTKYLSFNVKNSVSEHKKFSAVALNDIKKMIQSNFSIVYEEEKINFLWCLIGGYKKYKQFYVITEIIYF
jgi:hypothetical protein